MRADSASSKSIHDHEMPDFRLTADEPRMRVPHATINGG